MAETGAATSAAESADETDVAERSVHALIERLERLDELTTTQHVAVFDSAHAELSRLLGQLDAGQD